MHTYIHTVYILYMHGYIYSLYTPVSAGKRAQFLSIKLRIISCTILTFLFYFFLGEPHSLHVKPEDNPVIIDNGSCARFDLEIQDESGNITTNSRAPLIIHSKVCVYNHNCFSPSLTSRHAFNFSLKGDMTW